MKVCTKCNTEKNIDDFNKSRSGKDGVRSICKLCQKLERAVYVSANKDKERERVRKWRKEHPERFRKYDRKYIAEGKRMETINLWRKNNPDKIKAYKKSRRYLERGGGRHG